MISTFSDFTSNQSDILSQCADTSGEKSDLERKNELVNELRNKKQEGDVKMEELEGEADPFDIILDLGTDKPKKKILIDMLILCFKLNQS